MINRISSVALAVLLALAWTAPADAQDVNLILVGESGGDDVSIFLAEGQWAAGGIGMTPVVSLQTYLVTYDAGDVNASTWAFTPAAGLRFGSQGGFFQGLVGYSFKQQSDLGAGTYFGGAEDGVNITGHAQYWGTGAYGLQGIVSHNFGSEYLWSRARGTARVSDGDAGSFHVGAEAGWQGELGDETLLDPNYSAVMVGPVLQWSTPNLTALVGGGWKGIDDGAALSGDDSTWYIKAELVLTPRW